MNDAGLLPAPLAAEATKVAGLIAERLADEDVLSQAVRDATETSVYPYRWGGASLFGGHPGNALVFDHAARTMPDPVDRWRGAVRESLRRAALSTRESPIREQNLGYGTAGLALAVASCATDQPAYGPLLSRLHASLAQQVGARHDWRGSDGVAPGDYDLVQGTAGVLGYLLTVPAPDAAMRASIERLVAELSWLCAPPDSPRPERWRIAPARYPTPEDAEGFPDGYVDLGMAHGLPGPMTALCLAWSAGYGSAGVLDAVRHTARYLERAARSGLDGPRWPPKLPVDHAGATVHAGHPRGRDAWCYGAPGVCSALLDAANVLDDTGLRAAAVQGFEAVLRRLRLDSHAYSPTVCHGLAGILVLCHKFAIRTGSRLSGRSLADLTEAVLARCDPALPLVVQDLQAPEVRLDSPGFLDGAAGVALALWSVSHDSPRRWQRALLIS